MCHINIQDFPNIFPLHPQFHIMPLHTQGSIPRQFRQDRYQFNSIHSHLTTVPLSKILYNDINLPNIYLKFQLYTEIIISINYSLFYFINRFTEIRISFLGFLNIASLNAHNHS
jgi:hypothetical protein